MKHTLALVLMVFGIVGCATSYDKKFSGWEVPNTKLPNNIYYGYKILKNNNSIQIKTAGRILHKKENGHNSIWNTLCLQKFNTGLKQGPRANDTTWRMSDGTNFTWPEIFSIQCLTSDEKLELEEQKRMSERYWAEAAQNLKKRRLESKKTKCREYGFKDDSDGMGLCLIELDKLAAIKNQSEQANQAQLNILQQQQAEAKRQREANALMNLGAIIGGAGTPAPSSTRSKVTTPSYPTYTSSRTVPSNQLCPMLASPVVKQEVVRGNRICYYQ